MKAHQAVQLFKDAFRLAPAVIAIAGTVALSAANDARAQDLEPRVYSASPIGTNFLLLNYSYSQGDVGVDASLPVKDVKAAINVGQLGFSHTFNLAGHMSSYALRKHWLAGRCLIKLRKFPDRDWPTCEHVLR